MEPDKISPKFDVLGVSQFGPEILLTVTPLTIPSLAETIMLSLSELPAVIEGFHDVGVTLIVPQEKPIV